MAQIYLVSPDELAAHIGLRAKRPQDLDLEPQADDISRLVVATGVSARRLSQMTFRDEPASLRGFINIESRTVCPACADKARPGLTPRLREWTYPFALWCMQHGCRLQSGDGGRRRRSRRRGVRASRRGILARLGDGRRRDDPGGGGRVELAAHPLPIAFACGALGTRGRVHLDARRAAKGGPSLSAPGVELCRAGIRQRRRDLRSSIAERFHGLASARAVERRAVAIGLGRMIAFPVEAAVCILRRSDDFGRRQVEESLAVWPAHLRAAIERARRRVRREVSPTPWRREIGTDRMPRAAARARIGRPVRPSRPSPRRGARCEPPSFSGRGAARPLAGVGAGRARRRQASSGSGTTRPSRRARSSRCLTEEAAQ